ncbi:uncharacterized protein PgNI_12516 [Pyricularia grisea]|uniref:tetrahydrofolate synthase n=1 Tax=Pyricularia grisea TaxID=148305 RepID=A0A6P8AM73_PYRGI|nr:uncharacterized protein PgNI_12516 [Pyricularia grisea]TLD03135.1 hypothetical protein PgNI_12516 [Pyricularia grisea]
MSYQEALGLLKTRVKIFSPIANRGLQKRNDDLSRVRRWGKALGHDRKTFDVIHVTGTKGKGTTCAWTQALIQSYFQSNSINAKVGRYTSPHLYTPRERIAINSVQVSENVFAKHFFQVWNTILADVNGNSESMPGFLQFMALLSAEIFNRVGVAVAVYEVHAGGRFDATNMWDDTMVCGFNTIALDHVPMLGNNVKEIARNKAGILKSGCRAFSVQQSNDARQELEAEAAQLKCDLNFVETNESLIPKDPSGKDLRPADLNNLQLAIELANAYLFSKHNGRLSSKHVAEAMHIYNLPGRAQILEETESSTRWYLDIAHNDISIPVALDWFISEVWQAGHHPRVLIFGASSAQRNTDDVVRTLVRSCIARGFTFDEIVLASHQSSLDESILFTKDVACRTMDLWKEMKVVPSFQTIEQAIKSIRHADLGYQVLITGSAHLVSSAMLAMQSQTER